MLDIFNLGFLNFYQRSNMLAGEKRIMVGRTKEEENKKKKTGWKEEEDKKKQFCFFLVPTC